MGGRRGGWPRTRRSRRFRRQLPVSVAEGHCAVSGVPRAAAGPGRPSYGVARCRSAHRPSSCSGVRHRQPLPLFAIVVRAVLEGEPEVRLECAPGGSGGQVGVRCDPGWLGDGIRGEDQRRQGVQRCGGSNLAGGVGPRGRAVPRQASSPSGPLLDPVVASAQGEQVGGCGEPAPARTACCP